MNMSGCIESVPSSETNAPLSPQQTVSLPDEGMGNYAVTTPTTMAAKAPRAFHTFLDPPLLLLLLLLPEEELEGLEPVAVLLGEPELEPLGVAEEAG